MPSSIEKPGAPDAAATAFTGYQKFVAGLLAFLQFAVILDFMIMSPLGAMIMPALQISPRQFGLVVSAYAFSAGASGLLMAGFADRFDRKRLLLFFYAGFVLSTLWCGLAPSFELLLAARVVTGIFGGVIGSVVLAIATDLFAPQLRGRVMGVIQTAFAASQVLGLPVGLYLSNHFGWHAPFVAMAAFGAVGGLVIAWRMKPVADHLRAPQERSAFKHLLHTVTERRYLMAFATTALLTTGGFMLMPFSSAFTVNNLGIPLVHLPTIYLVTGACTIFVGPLVGKAADAWGKLRVFLAGSALTIVMVTLYTHLHDVTLPVVILVNVVMFVGIFSRIIPFQAMVTSVPKPTQRGAFTALSAATQQLSGGVASLVAGHIVAIGPDGRLQNFSVVGYVVVGSTLVAAFLATRVHRGIRERAALAPRAATA
ncbi:MFS transporter [Rhodoferax koreense]|uniref:MFS transporter n=1 Tax=Rhodoferax koreensis TaxID=1842727 RepID=A0A1P8JW86_9BURK|nr:MFS transporter [Rhodoferax koreense]APW37941.1 MFS transporter [Rhodoferax koreense]